MVNGLDVFSEYFEAYRDQYILIGGSACAVQMEDLGLEFRVTKDEDYYAFTLANSKIVNNLRVANYIALIALKARAFLNNLQRMEDGQQVQSTDISKHRSDVIRLTAVIPGDPVIAVIEKVKLDIALFIERGLSDPEQIRALLKSLRLGIDEPAAIIRQLRRVFGIGS